MSNKLKGAVRFLVGVITDRFGNDLTTMREALKAEADCGCGIDCCRGIVVVRDQATDVPYAVYVNNGVLVTKPVEDFLRDGPSVI